MVDDYAHNPTPSHLATFDQAHAKVSEVLDALIHTYAGVIADGTARREIHLAALPLWLESEYNVANLCDLLAVAIDRLTTTRQEQS